MNETAIAAYVRYFETLKPESVNDLRALAAPDMRFRDPFNDVTGVERVIAIMRDMFETADNPRFAVTDRAVSGSVLYLRWEFRFRPRRLGGDGDWLITGMSEVHFDETDRVVAHLDHWDAGSQFYARLPLLGGVIRFLRRRLAVD